MQQMYTIIWVIISSIRLHYTTLLSGYFLFISLTLKLSLSNNWVSCAFRSNFEHGNFEINFGLLVEFIRWVVTVLVGNNHH